MSTYTENRTQEDITEIHAATGLGCKACGEPIEPGTACTASGDVYCWACGLKLEGLGAAVQVLPTRAQAAEFARWAAAGVGAN
jgi:hypothetical protein